jgi:hypothetical protein
MTLSSFEERPPSGVFLFRSMTEAGDGRPLTGASGRMLGVRFGVDIQVGFDGTVRPGTGGVSVAPDDPMNLPPHRRPKEFGGTGRDPVWHIARADFGPHLTYRADPLNPTGHGFVEPARQMPADSYERAVLETRASWQRHSLVR